MLCFGRSFEWCLSGTASFQSCFHVTARKMVLVIKRHYSGLITLFLAVYVAVLNYNSGRMKIVINIHRDLLADLDGNLGQYVTRSECIRDLIRKYILLGAGPRAAQAQAATLVAQ